MRKRLGGILVLSLLAAAPLAAQEPGTSSTTPVAVQGFLEVSARASRVNGQTSPLLGLSATLGLGSRWRAGGAGVFVLERVDVPVTAPLPEIHLRMGYGGVLVERSSRPVDAAGANAGDFRWLLRLLLGAGNSEIRDSATEARQRSDNFLVVEPTLVVETSLTPGVHAGVVGGYRAAIGVDGLGAVEGADVSGPSLGVMLRFGPF